MIEYLPFHLLVKGERTGCRGDDDKRGKELVREARVNFAPNLIRTHFTE